MSVKYEELPALQSCALIARETLFGLKDLAKNRTRRDSRRVAEDYDHGDWLTVLREKKWLRCREVREYLIPKDDEVRTAKIKNRLVRIKTSDYYQYRMRILQEVMEEYAGSEPELVELGCGFGHNLFSLAVSNRWERLIGFEISENALTAAREAVQHFALGNIHFERLDLIDGSDGNFQKLEGKTAFTYYCLEQLKYDTSVVIENLIRSGVRRVIHIEPTFELLRAWSPLDWITFLYIVRKDYQDNLLKTLRSFEKKGSIKIIDQKRLGYAPTLRNDPTLVCWEPKVEPTPR